MIAIGEWKIAMKKKPKNPRVERDEAELDIRRRTNPDSKDTLKLGKVKVANPNNPRVKQDEEEMLARRLKAPENQPQKGKKKRI